MMPSELRIRIVNNWPEGEPKPENGGLPYLHPCGTQVILVGPDKEIDLTEVGSIQWPIQMEINERGAFAILKLPLDGADLGRIRG
jgi:hypothetical protein